MTRHEAGIAAPGSGTSRGVRSLRGLQIWHALWIAATPILFALFRLTSEPHDFDRQLVDNILVVWAGVSMAYVAIYFVLTGKRTEAVPDLLGFYRKQTQQRPFLWTSNLLGTALLAVILWHLALYRPVEFLSTADVELVLNDDKQDIRSLGIVRAKSPTSFRLPVGMHKIVASEVGTGENPVAKEVDVPMLIADPRPIRVTLRIGQQRIDDVLK